MLVAKEFEHVNNQKWAHFE